MKKVLLIDDEPSITKLVAANLRLTGRYEVAELNDPLQAVDRALEFKPHVIVLDLIMPGMDGGDVAALLKADPELGHVPVIFLTALVSPDEVPAESVIANGERAVLPKPVDIELLERCIEENIEGLWQAGRAGQSGPTDSEGGAGGETGPPSFSDGI